MRFHRSEYARIRNGMCRRAGCPLVQHIALIPRGKAALFTAWADPGPHIIKLTRVTQNAWIGNPLSNPACPDLVYPKFAWERVPIPPLEVKHEP